MSATGTRGERDQVGYGGEPRQVFRCPVCHGRGFVPGGFYGLPPMGTADEPCRSCGGRGYVGGTA